jgi:hypothetical protein
MNKWTVLYTFTYPAEAYLLKSRLEHTLNANPFYSQALGGVKLCVESSEVMEAQAFLEEIGYTQNHSPDESAKDASSNSPATLLLFLLGFGIFPVNKLKNNPLAMGFSFSLGLLLLTLLVYGILIFFRIVP